MFCNLSVFAQNHPTFSDALEHTNKEAEAFKSYDIFQSSSQPLSADLKAIATDIESVNVNASALSDIQEDQPDFLKFIIAHADETYTVKLQRVNLFADDFQLRNQNDETLSYNKGLYYRGKLEGYQQSVAVFNFFSESVNGIISERNKGNIIIGQLKDSDTYVVYDDQSMTVNPDFTCGVNDVEQMHEIPSQNQMSTNSSQTSKCVRVFYELTNDIYQNNNSSVSDTMNWMSSVHNIVASLYSDHNIPTVLSDVLIWQQLDPYTGENGEKLSFFRDNRNAINGDLAHLLDAPATGGVAYLNSLCQPSRYAFSGVSMNYQQLPTYSWVINVISHEMGHSLGSPHTHACFWNDDNTAIDSCGPDNGYSKGCDDGPTPTNGGTIMSYCHLDNNVGVNLGLGFHPQVGSYLDNNVTTKSCLGTDCVNSCMQTIADVTVTQSDFNSLTINIDDVLSNSWDYRIFEQYTNPGSFTTTNTNTIDINVQPATYYVIQVANICANGNYGGAFQYNFMSDADWCSGTLFTDSGGINNDYTNGENFVHTFYPNQSNQKLKLAIDSFDTELSADTMTIYDGESTDAPTFTNGEDLSGASVPPFTFQATNPAGAITVAFSSDGSVNAPGWEISFSCETFSVDTFKDIDIEVYPNPTSNKINIESTKRLDQIRVFDISGKMLLNKSINGQSSAVIDLSNLKSGVYLLKLNSDKASITKRIIKK